MLGGVNNKQLSQGSYIINVGIIVFIMVCDYWFYIT